MAAPTLSEADVQLALTALDVTAARLCGEYDHRPDVTAAGNEVFVATWWNQVSLSGCGETSAIQQRSVVLPADSSQCRAEGGDAEAKRAQPNMDNLRKDDPRLDQYRKWNKVARDDPPVIHEPAITVPTPVPTVPKDVPVPPVTADDLVPPVSTDVPVSTTKVKPETLPEVTEEDKHAAAAPIVDVPMSGVVAEAAARSEALKTLRFKKTPKAGGANAGESTEKPKLTLKLPAKHVLEETAEEEVQVQIKKPRTTAVKRSTAGKQATGKGKEPEDVEMAIEDDEDSEDDMQLDSEDFDESPPPKKASKSSKKKPAPKSVEIIEEDDDAPQAPTGPKTGDDTVESVEEEEDADDDTGHKYTPEDIYPRRRLARNAARRKSQGEARGEGRSLPKRDLKFELGLLTEFQRTQDLARKLRESKAAQVAPKPPRGAGRRSRKTKAVRVNTGHTKPDSTAAATGDESSAAVKIDRVTGKQTAVAPPRMRFGLLDADTDVDTPTGSESNTVGTMVLAGDSRKELVRDVAREAMAFFVEEFKDVLAMPKAMQAMHEDLSGQLAPLRTIPADLEKVSQGQTVLQDFSQVNKEITDIKLGNLETSTASLAAVTETLRLELHALKLAKTSNTVEDTAGMPQAVVEKPGESSGSGPQAKPGVSGEVAKD
ncbi:hypothetical protein A0H81_10347 [Grifola frondosa]|uniref:Uncharacterized protein n=1 Tax=Grifola frondosa TaxID=5627 RepID=A0A1C7LYJ3_GRIFR|nr:hypothetical protein A0H81_10347 [Grifola frondosa]